MKRIFALMMTLVLVFSLSVPAFGTDGTGSITITNATKDDTYSLYKIFDATYSTDADGNTDAVSYSIQPDNQFFTYMFGADGKAVNPCFVYDATTGAVTKKEEATKANIIAYLTEMVREEGKNYEKVATVKAADETVVFDNLPYGYYLIDKGVGTAVTIDSNTPSVNVIDKNQTPGSGFSKLIWDEDTKQWVSDTSANIGDIVDFEVKFQATNYDGEKQIKYYTIKDTKGNALWVEFDDIKVYVNGVELKQGYYHCTNTEIATGEWDYLGAWTEEKTPDNAEWYLIHHGYDAFDIVIPWMTDHDFTGTTNGFTLTYGDDAESKYDSPVEVIAHYKASVEPGATIGGGTSNNLWNQAELVWTSDVDGGPDDPSTTTTKVYALGLTKTDEADGSRLAGAEFEVYRDAACTDPVYVIPTDVKGVYILDDLNTIVSGVNRETSREKYADYLDAYLKGETQKNVVTTEANGKLVILGLEAGEYYLKETKAPDGYNKLSNAQQVTVGATNNTFTVITDAVTGAVIDATSADEGQVVHEYIATATVVENSKGIVLPSTGGKGTMMLISIGTLIAIAFGVLLITHKKMSIYND